jgi:hypothetical protein
MLRAAMQSVKVAATTLALATALVLVGGCYWSRYPEVMETHLVLLDQYARKLESFSGQGREVAIQDWAEYVYPLQRARDFARIAARRYPDRASLARFRETLDRYAVLVDHPSLLATPGGDEKVRADVAALEQSIAATRLALQREAVG